MAFGNLESRHAVERECRIDGRSLIGFDDNWAVPPFQDESMG
jgi:hypothetical protein